MANTLYPDAREAFANGDIDLLADDIRVVLLDSGYTYSEAHNFLNDVSAGFRVATSAALTDKTTTDGVFDAADVTFTAVSGDPVVALLIYKHTGNEATSNLIAFMDTLASGVAISITPDGTDIRVRWSNGTTRIFRL